MNHDSDLMTLAAELVYRAAMPHAAILPPGIPNIDTQLAAIGGVLYRLATNAPTAQDDAVREAADGICAVLIATRDQHAHEWQEPTA